MKALQKAIKHKAIAAIALILLLASSCDNLFQIAHLPGLNSHYVCTSIRGWITNSHLINLTEGRHIIRIAFEDLDNNMSGAVNEALPDKVEISFERAL